MRFFRSVALRLFLFCGISAVSSRSHAGDFSLDDDEDKQEQKADAPPPTAFVAPPLVTIRGHAYTLAECLALADRNHPSLWAARARLAYFHAQLDEAKWTPFWQWSASATFGVLPTLGGTPFYNAAPVMPTNASSYAWTSDLNPFFQFSVGGVVPFYTFGKIDSINRAAQAQVRVGEWDLEKFRQQVRMDVRRAYFGAMLARDAKYLVDEILERLDKAIRNLQRRLDKGDAAVEEYDRFRLDVYRDEVFARAGEPRKGEQFAVAGLRFLTGVQANFDIPDEPLKRPEVALGPIVRYLGAARLFRPEVNMARAGVAGRRAQVDLARARFFPDLGLGLGAGFASAPSATSQRNAWINDPWNGFGFGLALGARWNLDILPNAARVAQAESQLEETRALQRLALGGLAVEVESAYATAVEAERREQAWAAAEHRAKGWISSVQDAIDIGTKDERALTEPPRAYVNSRVNLSYALMDYNVALSDLARSSGRDSAAPN